MLPTKVRHISEKILPALLHAVLEFNIMEIRQVEPLAPSSHLKSPEEEHQLNHLRRSVAIWQNFYFSDLDVQTYFGSCCK